MALSVENSVWDSVKLITKGAQEKGSDPLLWALQVSSTLSSNGLSLPSIELANVIVSYICWDNNLPISWKFLEKALVLKIVPPLYVLALLSTRVIPCRRIQPAAYSLYMELLKRYAFALKSEIKGINHEKIMNSIDAVLHLSQDFGIQATDPGIILLEFIYSLVSQLVDASLDDEGLLELTPEKKSRWITKPQESGIENHELFDVKMSERHIKLRSVNTLMAMEIIGRFLQDKITSKLLYLVRGNLPMHWSKLIQNIQLLGSNSSLLRKSNLKTAEGLLQLTSNKCLYTWESKTSTLQKFHSVMAFGSPTSSANLCHGVSRSSLWIPLDLVLEDAMDGYQVNSTSAIEIIYGVTKCLQALNGSIWHDTFLGLWISALRLVQRERDPIEGPIPRLDTRLCMLLSIIPLVVAELIEEEVNEPADESDCGSTNHWKEKKVPGTLRNDLVSSLQLLGDYQDLLNPPQYVVSAANQAAAKAMLFVSGISIGSAYFECINMKEMPVNCSGNLRHLIVEACIARNLLDTQAYFWPGYVNGHINQLPNGVPAHVPGWSSFMKGAPLTPVMVSALVSSPATSLAELEKVYELAVNGSDDEKISAVTILCGASLLRGWNVQEHTVDFITRLLSPRASANHSGPDSHLISYARILNQLIVGIASVDSVQVFSLHGLVPQLACSLMPICEVFGSCVPDVSWTLPTGDKISVHAVFSNAFALLMKLWQFNHPPLEYGVGDVPTVGSQLTPEYLLAVRNFHLVSSGNTQKNSIKRRLSAVATSSFMQPVFLDSFPKLKIWYRQHQKCIASTLSGLVNGSPVHQIVNMLLSMMFRKIHRGSQSITTISSSSGSTGPGNEDSSLRPKLPAWDILEAVPFVVDAALTACAHGRLSPRELATGLKDLVDFLPGCLATVISYFSAEVSRGVWKPVFMNGTDWPSPAANLSNVDEKIKKILAATGVDVPSLAEVGSSPATLPLPLAAFVSLTITYKIDKASERFLNLAGPALESLAAGCPWPCMPIVASLWTQKAKRWFDFLVFSASRTVFLHSSDAVFQLLKSCFTTTLGLNATAISCNGGVGALLGHGFGSHVSGGISPVAPGILYLRVYRSIREIVFIAEEIIYLMMNCVREIACSGLPRERLNKLRRTKNGLKSGQISLTAAMTRVKLTASLGATLVWLSGGLSLVQSLFKETLPSWFITVQRCQQGEGPDRMVAMLGGYALAYFAVLCGAFAWGVDSSSAASKRRPKTLSLHLEFMAKALEGKISLGCKWATWHSYVSGFVSLMVDCTPGWVVEVNADVLKRLSRGLRQWDEAELASALLGVGGIETMGAAAELIVEEQ